MAMDYFTKCSETCVVPDQSAATTANRLVTEMFCWCGPLEELHSNQRQNFESQVFQEVCQQQGVTRTRTTPLQPQGNRLVDRFNHTLAKHLQDWDCYLPLVLWAYRSAVHQLP